MLLSPSLTLGKLGIRSNTLALLWKLLLFLRSLHITSIHLLTNTNTQMAYHMYVCTNICTHIVLVLVSVQVCVLVCFFINFSCIFSTFFVFLFYHALHTHTPTHTPINCNTHIQTQFHTTQGMVHIQFHIVYCTNNIW